MNYFSEIKNLTELVLASGHVKLITDLHGQIHEVYAQELESLNFFPVSILVGRSLTDCSNLELVKEVLETIELVNRSKQPAIHLISYSSKDGLIQIDCDVFPFTDQKFLLTLKHHHTLADDISSNENDLDPVSQIGLENLDSNHTSDSHILNFYSNSDKEIKTESELIKYSKELNPSTIKDIMHEIPGDPHVSLRSAEDQFIKIITRVPIPTLLIDEISLEIFFSNPSAINYFEYEDDELSRLSLFDLFPSSENHYLVAVIRKGGVLGLEADYSWRLITKKGIEKTARFLIQQLDYENRKILLVIILDTKDDSQLSFIKENANFLNLFEKDLLVVRMTPDGIITQVNQSFCDLLGKPLRKIIGSSVEENLFEEDYESVINHVNAITPLNPIRKNKNRIVGVNGKTYWIEWTDKGIFEGERLVEIYALGKDITETYQQELMQKSMEQRYQALVENLPMVVYVIHAKTFFPFYINPQVEKLTGYTPEEFYNKPEVWMNAMHPDDAKEFYPILQERIEKNISTPVEFRMYHKDGRLRWVEETGSTITMPDGTLLFQGISRDVTGRHNAREKLIYYSKFERLIIEFSLKLMNATTDNLPIIIKFIVDELGKFMQVDRAYIFDINYQNKTMSNTYEWCNDCISSQMEKLQNISLSTFPWWMERINNNQDIVIEKVSEMPEEAYAEKENLTTQEIKSLLVVPFIYDNKPIGFIGFDMLTERTDWEQESINLLRLVSTLIISASERFANQSNLKI